MFFCVCVLVESIVEAALCKSVLKPLREPIYQSLEKLHAGDSSLKQLAQKQVGWMDGWMDGDGDKGFNGCTASE